ncbi:hypothetical protein FS837_007087 [Tulasnella sp. UAMH 9824]|nr:hypothetical protein FS837_007087 [Tulasnella sp. UAMH 9824]
MSRPHHATFLRCDAPKSFRPKTSSDLAANARSTSYSPFIESRNNFLVTAQKATAERPQKREKKAGAFENNEQAYQKLEKFDKASRHAHPGSEQDLQECKGDREKVKKGMECLVGPYGGILLLYDTHEQQSSQGQP